MQTMKQYEVEIKAKQDAMARAATSFNTFNELLRAAPDKGYVPTLRSDVRHEAELAVELRDYLVQSYDPTTGRNWIGEYINKDDLVRECTKYHNWDALTKKMVDRRIKVSLRSSVKSERQLAELLSECWLTVYDPDTKSNYAQPVVGRGH